MTDPKQIAIDKETERSEIEGSSEMRERELTGLRKRKPVKLNLSDEWCLEAADREAAIWPKHS